MIAAPSGAGKTTFCRRLLSDFPNLILSISCTTRAPRGNELEGRDYFFISREEFKNRIQADQFAEWAKVHDHFYGTSKDFIERAFSEGKSLLLDIDVQGADSIFKSYPKECVRVFIAPPSIETLESRLRKRGTDSEEVIQKRLQNARGEVARMGEFDFVIINDSLERAYSEMRSIIEAELSGKKV